METGHAHDRRRAAAKRIRQLQIAERPPRQPLGKKGEGAKLHLGEIAARAFGPWAVLVKAIPAAGLPLPGNSLPQWMQRLKPAPTVPESAIARKSTSPFR